MTASTVPLDRRSHAAVGWAAVAIGWVITVADALLPLSAGHPAGLIAFLLATALSIAANVVAIVAGGGRVLRSMRRSGARVASPATSAASGVLLIAVAALSIGAERIVGLIAVLR